MVIESFVINYLLGIGANTIKNKAIKWITGLVSDFSKAVQEVQGHALALTLLGNYIKKFHKGDIRQRDQMQRLTEGAKGNFKKAERLVDETGYERRRKEIEKKL